MAANPAFPPQLLEMLARQIRSGQFELPAAAAPPQPEVVDPEEAKRRALAAVTEARAYVSDIIRQTNAQTEAGVLQVGSELTQIVTISKSYITEVRETFSKLQSSDGDGERGGSYRG